MWSTTRGLAWSVSMRAREESALKVILEVDPDEGVTVGVKLPMMLRLGRLMNCICV
jgi:hypothetical protein